MANEISMAEKQTIALLHAQGVSNREMARILGLDRGTVNRQVRWLKAQNRPEAPPGNFTANPPVGGAGVPAEGHVDGTDAEGTERGETSRPECDLQAVIEAQRTRVAMGGLAETCQVPAGMLPETDVIWEEEASVANWQSTANAGNACAVDRLQNRPEAPAGKFSQKELFDTVPRLAFATWDDPLGGPRGRTLAIQNQPEAPPGESSGKEGLREDETGFVSRRASEEEADLEKQVAIQNQPEAPLGKTAENSATSRELVSDNSSPSGQLIPGLVALAPYSTKQPGVTTSLCTEFHELIVTLLERGLEAQRIWQDLVTDHGFTGKYWSVKRYVAKLRARRPLPFRRLETGAGVEAQVDFGQGAWVLGPDGKRRRPWVFRVILSHSRKGYSEVVWRQTTELFIECLENAFRYFGGVPARIVLDNLKAAVTRADWYDPEIHPKIQSFAAHHGTVFLPTKPYTPRHKGKVEGGVKYVQNNALAGRSFPSLEEQNEYLWRWESQVADQRIHGTTKRQVRALFEEQERAALRPLPAARFPMFREEQRTVHRDGYVEVDKAYYAAPPEYVGRTVWVRWDSRIVRIYDDRWSALYTHASTTIGKFRSCEGAIPREKMSAVERGVEALLKQVSRIGPRSRDWSAATVQARGVEATRVLVGLQSLTRQHEAAAIEQACELALASGSYRLRTIRELLKRRRSGKQEQFEFTQEHPVIRPLADYSLETLFEFRRDRATPTPSLGVER